MIVLDSNVLSALMRPDPDSRIVRWLDSQASESIWTTSINVYEVRFGIELLSPGRRRETLHVALRRLVEEALEGRVLAFDSVAADAAAVIAANQRRAGRTVEIRDVQIAGIALARRATLATRNIRHFEGIGLDIVDPWSP